MSKKVKVYNRNKHDVGIVLMNGIPRNVVAGSFMLLDEDDIAFLMSTTTVFTGHHLSIEDDEVIADLGVEKDEVFVPTDDDIEKKLKSSNNASLKKYLEGITELHLRKRICQIAKGLDLPASKIKLIEDEFDLVVYGE